MKKTNNLKIAILFVLIIGFLICPVYIINNTGSQTQKTVYITEVSRTAFASDKAMAYGVCENDFISFHISPDDYILFKNNEFKFNEEYIVTGRYSHITKSFNNIVSLVPNN